MRDTKQVLRPFAQIHPCEAGSPTQRVAESALKNSMLALLNLSKICSINQFLAFL